MSAGPERDALDGVVHTMATADGAQEMDSALPPRLEKVVWISRCALRLMELQPLLGALKAQDLAEMLAESLYANFAEPGYAALEPEQFAETYMSTHQKPDSTDSA